MSLKGPYQVFLTKENKYVSELVDKSNKSSDEVYEIEQDEEASTPIFGKTSTFNLVSDGETSQKLAESTNKKRKKTFGGLAQKHNTRQGNDSNECTELKETINSTIQNNSDSNSALVRNSHSITSNYNNINQGKIHNFDASQTTQNLVFSDSTIIQYDKQFIHRNNISEDLDKDADKEKCAENNEKTSYFCNINEIGTYCPIILFNHECSDTKVNCPCICSCKKYKCDSDLTNLRYINSRLIKQTEAHLSFQHKNYNSDINNIKNNNDTLNQTVSCDNAKKINNNFFNSHNIKNVNYNFNKNNSRYNLNLESSNCNPNLLIFSSDTIPISFRSPQPHEILSDNSKEEICCTSSINRCLIF